LVDAGEREGRTCWPLTVRDISPRALRSLDREMISEKCQGLMRGASLLSQAQSKSSSSRFSGRRGAPSGEQTLGDRLTKLFTGLRGQPKRRPTSRVAISMGGTTGLSLRDGRTWWGDALEERNARHDYGSDQSALVSLGERSVGLMGQRNSRVFRRTPSEPAPRFAVSTSLRTARVK